MAEALAKLKSGILFDANTNDSDGQLVAALLDALSPASGEGHTSLSFLDNGASPPTGVEAGQIFRASSITGSDNLFFYTGGVSQTIVTSAYALAGDVTGTLGATVVGNDTHSHTDSTLPDIEDLATSETTTTKVLQPDGLGGLQWNASASGATELSELSDVDSSLSPSEEHILYFSGSYFYSGYPGMVNDSRNKSFIILAAGSSVSEINTALTDYDIVYLEPGSYGSLTTQITVPAGKRLIGLGDVFSANRVQLSFSSSPASRHILLQDGWIENIYVYSTSPTTDIIEGDSTYENNVAHRIRVEASTTSSVWAFIGTFSDIGYIVALYTDGVYINGTDSTVMDIPGMTVIERFYIYNAPTYGIRLGNVSNVIVRDGWVDGASSTTDYGIYQLLSSTHVYRITIDNVIVSNVSTSSFSFAGTSSYSIIDLNVSRCHSYGGTYVDRGFYFEYVLYTTVSDCTSISASGGSGASYGDFIFTTSNWVTATNLIGALNASTTATLYVGSTYNSTFSNVSCRESGYGVYLSSIVACSFSNFALRDTASYGIYGTTVSSCSFSNVSIYDAGGTTAGMYLTSAEYNTISNVVGYNCNVSFYYNGNFSSISNVTSISSAGIGIQIAGDSNTLTGLVSYLSSSIGIYVSANYTSMSAFRARDNTGIGIDIVGHYCTGSGFSTYSNDDKGFYASSYYAAFAAISSYSNTSYGIEINNCDGSVFTGLTSRSNSSYGVVGQNGSTQTRVDGVGAYGNTTYDLYFPAISGTSALHGAGYQSGKDSVHADWIRYDTITW